MEEYQTPESPREHRSARWVMPTIIAVLVLVLIGLVVKYSVFRHSSNMQVDELKDYVNQVTGTIDSIQTSLDRINPEQQLITLTGDLNQPNGDKTNVVRRMAALEELLNRNQARIQELEDQMNKKDVRIENLNKMIDGLRKRLDKSERLVLAQKAKIDSLSTANASLQGEIAVSKQTNEQLQLTLTDVSGQRDQLKDQVSNRDEQIARATREKFTVYYVVGTRKDLLKKKIIEEHGKVAFFGGARQVSRDVRDDEFSTMEVANGATINIPGRLKKVEVVSAQSRSSYSMQAAGINASVLTVTDAEQFCRVKYLVVVID